VTASLQDNLPYLAGLVLALIAVVAVTAVLRRRKRHKPIFPTVPKGARYAQRFVSGRSLRFWRTRLIGVPLCLTVYMIEDRLVITPTFPLTLTLLPEALRLEHVIRRRAIVRVSDKRGLLGTKVIVEFRTDKDEGFELRLRRPDVFMKALATR
jgi:hypothetical protein